MAPTARCALVATSARALSKQYVQLDKARSKGPRPASLSRKQSSLFRKVTFTSTLYPIPAPYGFYKDSGGNIAQCPENSYCPSPFHDPIACPSGWWSPAGLWTCVPNAPGGNAPYAFGTSTPTAPKNYEMGSDYLFPCPAGMYANAGSGKCTMIESA